MPRRHMKHTCELEAPFFVALIDTARHILFTYMYLPIGGARARETEGQLWGVGFLLPFGGPQNLNSGCQTWRQPTTLSLAKENEIEHESLKCTDISFLPRRMSYQDIGGGGSLRLQDTGAAGNENPRKQARVIDQGHVGSRPRTFLCFLGVGSFSMHQHPESKRDHCPVWVVPLPLTVRWVWWSKHAVN